MIDRKQTTGRIKVMSVFGTRPEATKMAPLILSLQQDPQIESIVTVTAQHRELLDPVLSLFQIHPDYDLNIMRRSQTLTSIAVRALEGLEQVYAAAKPDLVLVHGDTSSAFIGALSAYYAKIPVGHVEAGLRTYDKYSPFPEEMNRRLISSIADLHFCPTPASEANLRRENCLGDIYVTGNTAIDTVHMLAKESYTFRTAFLNDPALNQKRLIFMTAHRRENYGAPLEQIMYAVRDLVEWFQDLVVVYPMHPSPTVRQTATSILGHLDRVFLCEPLLVDDSINLIRKSYLVLTDSGGLQEEAPSLGKPVLVLRSETERPEAIDAGTVSLIGTDRAQIVSAVSTLLTDPHAYETMSHAVNPYGDGKASQRILAAILHHFGRGTAPDPFPAQRM